MENRVTFSKEFTDAYGMSQPTFDFKLSTKGHLDAHRMMQDTEKVAGELGGISTVLNPVPCSQAGTPRMRDNCSASQRLQVRR
jgi:hypothetical protein